MEFILLVITVVVFISMMEAGSNKVISFMEKEKDSDLAKNIYDAMDEVEMDIKK